MVEREIARKVLEDGLRTVATVLEEDWEVPEPPQSGDSFTGESNGIQGSGSGVGGGTNHNSSSGGLGERKRDRIGHKIRQAFNLPSSGEKSSHKNSRMPSPNPSPNLPSPATFTSNASSSKASSGAYTPPPIADSEVKRPNRHSIQVLPKSYSAVALAPDGGAAARAGAERSALKGIRDLDPGWSDVREKEGRKRTGYLWCNGAGKPGDQAARGGLWERCWCEVKQSQLVEYRPGVGGVETASTTDLMFASVSVYASPGVLLPSQS